LGVRAWADASFPSIGYVGHLVSTVAAHASDTRDPCFSPIGKSDLVIELGSESLSNLYIAGPIKATTQPKSLRVTTDQVRRCS